MVAVAYWSWINKKSDSNGRPGTWKLRHWYELQFEEGTLIINTEVPNTVVRWWWLQTSILKNKFPQNLDFTNLSSGVNHYEFDY
jgi:hypothetical protein